MVTDNRPEQGRAALKVIALYLLSWGSTLPFLLWARHLVYEAGLLGVNIEEEYSRSFIPGLDTVEELKSFALVILLGSAVYLSWATWQTIRMLRDSPLADPVKWGRRWMVMQIGLLMMLLFSCLSCGFLQVIFNALTD